MFFVAFRLDGFCRLVHVNKIIQRKFTIADTGRNQITYFSIKDFLIFEPLVRLRFANDMSVV
jgi:hypothetical protein